MIRLLLSFASLTTEHTWSMPRGSRAAISFSSIFKGTKPHASSLPLALMPGLAHTSKLFPVISGGCFSPIIASAVGKTSANRPRPARTFSSNHPARF